MFCLFTGFTSLCETYTVKPVLSAHPELSGQLLQCQTFLSIFTVKRTCIQRTPLLSGRGHRNGAGKTCIERTLQEIL